MPWVSVDSGTAMPKTLGDKFPKLSLKKAFHHNIGTEKADAKKGDKWEVVIKDREEWERVVVKYECVDEVTLPGTAAQFRKTYLSDDKTVTFLHIHKDKDDNVVFTQNKFYVPPP